MTTHGRSGGCIPLNQPCPEPLDRPHSPSPSEDAALDLIAADRAMQRAVLERDVLALAAFLTDDYVLVDSRGREHDKGAVLKELLDPEIRIAVNETQDHRVRLHGETAVVIAVLQQRGMDHGTPYDVPVRFTDTWIRRNGRWLCLSGHASRLD
jgi:ketosteroid isomerase-like protein